MNRHALVLLAALAAPSCLTIPKERMVDVEHPLVTTESGVRYQDRLTGTGELTPIPGMSVTIDYVCTLEDGSEVDSTYARGRSVTFTHGEAWIPGIDRGTEGMRVGGKRLVIVPPELAYGELGVAGLIPADAELHFEIELLALE